jgi:hypothetical protein
MFLALSECVGVSASTFTGRQNEGSWFEYMIEHLARLVDEVFCDRESVK